MATGKVTVVRRGDLSHVSRKGFSFFGADGNGDFDFGFKRGVFVDDDIKVRVKEAMEVDDEIVCPPPQKKRKLSPYLWNKDDAVCSLSAQQENLDDDDHEPGQIDEEDFTRAPNILMSRWACDDDVEERSHEEKEMNGRRSSPESVITQKEGSNASGSRSSESGGCVLRVFSADDCSESGLENDDCMELDVSDDEYCGASEGGSDCDDGSKNGVPGLGSRNIVRGCRSVFDYERVGKISEGSYGIVYKARDKESGEMVALKKMKMGSQREGFPVYYLREINTLMALNHPSIVNVREVVVDDTADGFDNIYMVMDYVEHDLKALMQTRKQPFTLSEVKCLMLQLLEGVKYLHDNWVLHRDLKTSNLLLSNKGGLKICDFGMARQYGSPLMPYTALVVTLWYRAPELLLGVKEYSTAVDMWSVGCIMTELLTNKPLFDGKSEVEQLDKIFRTLGTPNDKLWPGYSQLSGVKGDFVHQPYNQLHKKFPRASFTSPLALSDLGLDLLSRLLTYDPEKRITAKVALNHPWFQEVPLPNSRDFIPTCSSDK